VRKLKPKTPRGSPGTPEEAQTKGGTPAGDPQTVLMIREEELREEARLYRGPPAGGPQTVLIGREGELREEARLNRGTPAGEPQTNQKGSPSSSRGPPTMSV